jgi:hypothetical protein
MEEKLITELGRLRGKTQYQKREEVTSRSSLNNCQTEIFLFEQNNFKFEWLNNFKFEWFALEISLARTST